MKLILLTAVLVTANTLAAQEPATTTSVTAGTSSGTTTVNYDSPVWSIGLSGSVVDDDGETFNDLFNVGDSWNFLPFPTRLHVEMATSPRWSFEGAVTYNTLQSGKVFNDVVLDKDHMFLAVDVNAKFHFIKSAKVFDPYGVGGLGFTYRSVLQNQTPTLNAGIGANIWFVPSFGLNLQSTAKVKLISSSSNYLLHSLGVVYRFGQ